MFESVPQTKCRGDVFTESVHPKLRGPDPVRSSSDLTGPTAGLKEGSVIWESGGALFSSVSCFGTSLWLTKNLGCLGHSWTLSPEDGVHE